MGSEEDHENPAVDEESSTPAKPAAKNRQYLVDRVKGTSKYDEGRRPPCSLCWVPMPVLLCPGFLEQNPFCESVGKVGCVDHDDSKIRRRLIIFGVLANVASFFLTVFACFAITQDFDLLHTASFSRGTAFNADSSSVVYSYVDIGLKAVAIESLGASDSQIPPGKYVYRFDEFCDLATNGLERYLPAEDCDKCNEASGSLVSTLILSMITTIPTIGTDTLRLFPNYDVNCQKFFGTILSFVSMILSLVTFLKYNQSCFATFYDGIVPFYLNGTVASEDADGPVGLVDFDWNAGKGLICMYAAAALKAVDILVLAIIPTPNITRDPVEQAEYEAKYGNGGDQAFEDGKEESEIS
jgi:hypothetical protein